MAKKKSAQKPTSTETSYELSGNVDHGSVVVVDALSITIHNTAYQKEVVRATSA